MEGTAEIKTIAIEPALNLWQKLVEIRRQTDTLGKENSGYNFKFVSSSQVINAVKQAMDDHGVLLTVDITKSTVGDHETKKHEHEYFTEIWTDFVWINADNPKEQMTLHGYGQGLDTGEKGVGKAMTYAEKYFFLKQFNIPTDKDDPDANAKRPEKQYKQDSQRPQAPAEPVSGKATTDQFNEINRLLAKQGIPKEKMRDMIRAAAREPFDKIVDLTAIEASFCISRFISAKQVAEIHASLPPVPAPPAPAPAAPPIADTEIAESNIPF